MNRPKPTDKYKYCNHFHELTDEYEFVDFGDGEFVANKKAIPLLKALAEVGLRTRIHHIDENGGFFSIIVEPHVQVYISQVNESHSTRDKYNGLTEVLITFRKEGDNDE